jgi:hypothetical protein
MLQINTVVNYCNVHEDMNRHFFELEPFRWKCFQILIAPGENDSKEILRNTQRFTITDDEFNAFCKRHAAQKYLVPESNQVSSFLNRMST